MHFNTGLIGKFHSEIEIPDKGCFRIRPKYVWIDRVRPYTHSINTSLPVSSCKTRTFVVDAAAYASDNNCSIVSPPAHYVQVVQEEKRGKT